MVSPLYICDFDPFLGEGILNRKCDFWLNRDLLVELKNVDRSGGAAEGLRGGMKRV